MGMSMISTVWFYSVDNLRLSLEADGAKGFHRVLFATAIVVIGCMLEVGDTISTMRRWWRTKNSLPLENENLTSWTIPASAIGLFLIIGGIVCEGVFEVQVDRATTALREHEAQVLGSAETQAAGANEKASIANREAARLQVDAERLEEQISEQGPRELLLFGNREKVLLSSLTEMRGQKIQIRICEFNRETRALALRLTYLFAAAGWVVSSYSPDWGESNCLVENPAASGLWVGIPNNNPTAKTVKRSTELLQILSQVPLTSHGHSVRPETARGNAAHESVQGRYDPPDGLVLAVLVHPLETESPPFHGGAGIMF